MVAVGWSRWTKGSQQPAGSKHRLVSREVQILALVECTSLIATNIAAAAQRLNTQEHPKGCRQLPKILR